MLFQSSCAKGYGLVYKNEFSRQPHPPYHITSLLQTSKSKNIGSANLKNIFHLNHNGNDNHNINVQGINGDICFLDFKEIGVFAHEVFDGSARDKDEG